MPEAPTLPNADHLFQKWKQLLDDGNLTTASVLAGGRADLTSQLQLRINDYLSVRAACLEETLTAAADPRDEPDSPPTLKDYTVLGPLGRGGMGEVYRVRDALDREFALKVARRGQLSATGRARFLDEARTMARLDHPHVARVHHFGLVNDEQPYFTMRVYPASLKDRLAEYQADPRKAVRLMAEVAEGVGHLHAAGLVHRDLKPHNILLDEAGRPAVSDFGLVKDVSDSSVGDPLPPGSGTGETRPTGAKRSRTISGAAIGTRAYMAPEQAAGLTHLANSRWDVWALGVILHQLLTGEFPKSSEAPERLLDPSEPDNPAPSTIAPRMDVKLERVVRKCLAREESDRYADARELSRDLSTILGERRARRRQNLLVATLGVLAVGLLVTLGIAIRSDQSKTESDDQRRTRLQAELSDRLANGEAVVLINEDGKCPYGFRLIGTQPGTNPIDLTGGFVASGIESVLAELVPEKAVPPAFEISGDVRYIRQAAISSFAGLYYGHNPGSPSDAVDHTFAYFGYREFSSEDATRRATLKDIGPENSIGEYALGMAHWVDPVAQRLPLGSLRTPLSRPFATPRYTDTADKPARRIVLRVSEATVAITFRDIDLGEESHARMHDLWMTMHRDRLPRERFGPRGGVGVYVQNATVAFRNVQIRALPQ